MTPRVERIKKELLDTYYDVPLCAEKMRYVTEALKKYEGYHDMVKNAHAFAHFLDNRTLFIEDDQLLVGNIAAKPHGMEYHPCAPLWPDDDLDNLLKEGFTLDPEDRKFLRDCDDFWLDTGRTFSEMETFYYEEETDRLWNFRKRGMHMPAFTDRKVGFSAYTAGWGWSMQHPTGLNAPDLEMHIYTGYQAFIDACKKAMVEMHFEKMEDMDRYDGLYSMIISMEAVIRMYERYADLADKMAAECADKERAGELREMARICRKVPKYGAETYQEGLQHYIISWLLFAHAAHPLGRMDKILWPLLERDLKEGRITEEKAYELTQCFLLKVFDYNFVTGMPTQREKYAGRARWNVIMLGGRDSSGKDVTSPLTYMILKASRELHLAHPSIHVRVYKDTPEELMIESLKSVREGLGYPSFISEEAYVDYIVEHTHGGITRQEALDFIVHGCVDSTIPGRSRQTGVPMMPVPVILELAVDGGKDNLMGTDVGASCKTLGECASYEEFYNDSFLPNIEKVIRVGVEITIVRYGSNRMHAEDPIRAAFFEGALEDGRDPYFREMKYETACGVNLVGMATAIDSLVAIKYICFDKKTATPQKLMDALAANWEGYEDLRLECVKAPKYGNGDNYADDIGEKLWNDIHDISRKFKGPYGNELCLSAVSITTHAPAGAVTGATANGRFAGEVLSDASVSPSQGADTNGPTAVFRSAMRMGKGFSSTLHNMKFPTSTIKTDEDLQKLSSMLRVYLTSGGHQIQMNVVDQKTLVDAQEHPEKHGDLIVRVAGYSTYFTLLNKTMQGDVINRTAHENI